MTAKCNYCTKDLAEASPGVLEYKDHGFCCDECFINGLSLIGAKNPLKKLRKTKKKLRVRLSQGERLIPASQMRAGEFRKHFTDTESALAERILSETDFLRPSYASGKRGSSKEGRLDIFGAKGRTESTAVFRYQTHQFRSLSGSGSGATLDRLLERRMFLIEPDLIQLEDFSSAPSQEHGAKFGIKGLSTFQATKNLNALVLKLKTTLQWQTEDWSTDRTLMYFALDKSPDKGRQRQLIAVEFTPGGNGDGSEMYLSKIIVLLYKKTLTRAELGLVPKQLFSPRAPSDLPPPPPRMGAAAATSRASTAASLSTRSSLATRPKNKASCCCDETAITGHLAPKLASPVHSNAWKVDLSAARFDAENPLVKRNTWSVPGVGANDNRITSHLQKEASEASLSHARAILDVYTTAPRVSRQAFQLSSTKALSQRLESSMPLSSLSSASGGKSKGKNRAGKGSSEGTYLMNFKIWDYRSASVVADAVRVASQMSNASASQQQQQHGNLKFNARTNLAGNHVLLRESRTPVTLSKHNTHTRAKRATRNARAATEKSVENSYVLQCARGLVTHADLFDSFGHPYIIEITLAPSSVGETSDNASICEQSRHILQPELYKAEAEQSVEFLPETADATRTVVARPNIVYQSVARLVPTLDTERQDGMSAPVSNAQPNMRKIQLIFEPRAVNGRDTADYRLKTVRVKEH